MKLAASLSAALTALVAFILPGCDMVNLPEIKPGITHASEVRSRLGEPGAQYSNDDGSITWEYDRQPNGIHCYMITIGPDQIVQKMEQVLTEANFAKVRDGMTPPEIRRLFGRPGSIQRFNNLREDIWEWRVAGTIPTEETYFMVHFDTDSGLVKKTSKRVAMKG
jgi:hypothetical protein